MVGSQVDRKTIEEALAAVTGADFPAEAEALLDALGYRSDRRLEGQSGSVDGFFHLLEKEDSGTKSRQALRENAASLRILFQVTTEEVAQAAKELASARQLRMLDSAAFDGAGFNSGNAKSFLFIAVELTGGSYPRGRYAQFTREISKPFAGAPAVVLFRTSTGLLTVAFAHVRPNKRKEGHDVLGKVSLVREVNPRKMHGAHRAILAELALPERLGWIRMHDKHSNFDGLLAAWLDTLDTEALNRRFYKALFVWFERACGEARFPSGVPRAQPPQEHVMRLVTRLMFVWFVKEKGLVADELFTEQQVHGLLKDYDRDSGDSYYRTVLQNLFFATLNTPINERGFRKQGSNRGYNPQHRIFSQYRYEQEIGNPQRLLALFDETPFINGGLFDCLDSVEAVGKDAYRIDYFSDNVIDPKRAGKEYQAFSIPNRLFFDDGGLITLFNRYKFTVEENTPAEQEVALDPELLGKVFENLLAAITPETRENARKQTGSFYTPREVVDYMVDEALVASIAQNAQPAISGAAFWQERIRYLLDYNRDFDDADELFTEAERRAVVRAVANLKVLDPAVGYGAFPMGVLHKLTLVLSRLDRENKYWRELQLEIAGERAKEEIGKPDEEEGNAELREINATFHRYGSSDFGRKLYLIQNSIYGVDLQPVACQIAKLRFFISLAIEQQSSGDPNDNYGIKPLPNLEARFVAANTLLGLEKPLQPFLQSEAALRLERELTANRERWFHAGARRDLKLHIRNEDKRVRNELETELVKAGMPAPDAHKVAQWDPYDHNAHAGWFDPKHMFGIDEGFDITIGNPPYVRSESSDKPPAYQEMRDHIIQSRQYQTLHEKWDLYIPFIEQSYKLLKPGGFTTLIVSDAYCHARYAKKSREYFLQNARIVRLDFFSKIQVFEAGVRNITYLYQKADGSDNTPQRRVHTPAFGIVSHLPSDLQRHLTERVFFPEDASSHKFPIPTIPLSEICYITYGLRPSSLPDSEESFVTADLTQDYYDEVHSKPYVDGKHLDNWLPATNIWIEWGTERAPSKFARPTFAELFEVPKILAVRSPGPFPKACYDDNNLVFTPSSVGFILWDDLSGVRNNSIRKTALYQDELVRSDKVHNREKLEEISRQFSVKYLLAVMNSGISRQVLRSNRRSNIHLYPDDWKSLPIPNVSEEQQSTLTVLVDQLIDAKKAKTDADTSVLEAQIDRLVYALYGLAEEEIAVVEGRDAG